MSNIKTLEKLVAFNPPLSWIKERILDAGSKIGNIHFYKRSNGEERRMCYKLHVSNPSVVKSPKAKPKNSSIGLKRCEIDNANNLITLYDCNKVVKDNKGNIIGRGSYRSIPLDGVKRICNNGKEYIIEKY